MRRTGTAWIAVFICAAATGCLDRLTGLAMPGRAEVASERSPRAGAPGPSSSSKFGGLLQQTSGEGLRVLSVLIERPLGDAFLDRDLWTFAHAPLPPETNVVLAENGLRVLVLGGNLPPAFQKLLESDADTVNPHGLTFANRQNAVLPTAGPIDRCEFEVLPDLAGKKKDVKLAQARCGIAIRPEQTVDGRVKVWCEPQIQHGERQDWWRPTSDGTQFVVQGEAPVERYPTLGFEVTLGQDEYLIVGWPAAAKRTLGSALFAVEANGRPRQRVLVIRAASRGTAATDGPTPPPPHDRRSIAAEVASWKK